MAKEIYEQRRIKQPSEIIIINQNDIKNKISTDGSDTEGIASQFSRSYCSLVVKEKEDKGCEGKIKNISYLKGLDAYQQAIDKEDQNKDDQTAKKWGERLSIIDRHNPPIGSARFDYLHRLAIEIKNTHKELDPSKRIKAVGVFGNDFYDKLLIFQALRKEMPNIVLFTTDLDAQMFYPEHWRWTRNLIVASHFDLKLGEEHQIQSPPFRDSQQTAIYYATRIAAGDSKLIGKEVPPLLFEIGRNGPVHLFLPEYEQQSTQSVHPDYDNAHQLKLIWGALATITLILIFLVYEIRPHSGILILWLISSTLVFYFLWHIALNKTNAPFSIADGISLWPTIIIRIIACLLVVLFFIKSIGTLEANFHRLNRKYFNNSNSLSTLFEDKNPSSFKEIIQNSNSYLSKLDDIDDLGWARYLLAFIFILTSSILYWVYINFPADKTLVPLFPFIFPCFWILILMIWATSDLGFEKLFKFPLEPLVIFLLFCISIAFISYDYFPEIKVTYILIFIFILFSYYILDIPGFKSIKVWIEDNTSWSQLTDQNQKNLSNKIISLDSLWYQYYTYGRIRQRLLRMVAMWLFFVTIAVVVDSLLPSILPVWPSPCRGASCDWDSNVQTISFIVIMLLIIFVLDALRLCFYWIQKMRTTHPLLVDWTTLESSSDLVTYNKERSKKGVLESLEDIVILVAKRTRVVDRLIYYPLIAMMLMFFARIKYFDNLDFPLALGITFAASITLLIFAGFKLRSEAERLRIVVIDRSEILAKNNIDANITVQKIRSINYGAFYPMLEQPVMRALLLILASLGLFASEYIMIFG